MGKVSGFVCGWGLGWGGTMVVSYFYDGRFFPTIPYHTKTTHREESYGGGLEAAAWLWLGQGPEAVRALERGAEEHRGG